LPLFDGIRQKGTELNQSNCFCYIRLNFKGNPLPREDDFSKDSDG